jgi:hypothetical protein
MPFDDLLQQLFENKGLSIWIGLLTMDKSLLKQALDNLVTH